MMKRNKESVWFPPLVLLLALWFLLFNTSLAEDDFQIWTAPDGRQIQATLEAHDLDQGVVKLHTDQGREVELSYSQLSQADVERLTAQVHELGEDIMREWTSSDGTKIMARLVAYHEDTGQITLRRQDGREFTVAPDRFANHDREHIANHAAILREAREKALAEIEPLLDKTIRYQVEAEETRTFHVYYPPAYSPDARLPILLLFSPGGGGGGMIRNFREPAKELGWILVGVDGPRNNQALEIGDRMVADMMPEIQKTVAYHDPEHWYASGLSGGAIRAFQTVTQHDLPWKGVISLGGWMGRNPDSITLPKGIAVAWVNGDEDRNANAYVSRDSGLVPGETKLFPFPGGHVIGPADVLGEAMAWVRAQHDE